MIKPTIILGLCLLLTLPGLAEEVTSQPSTCASSCPDSPDAPPPEAVSQPADATTSEAASQPESQPASVYIAHVNLSGTLQENEPDFALFASASDPSMTLRNLLQRLAKIRNDNTIDAVALEIENLQLSFSQAEELSDAINRLSEVKPVYAYLLSGGTAQYLVASAADEIAFEPTGTLYMTGLAAELLFFRDTLGWLGMEPQMIQIGRFKGAAEPFMNQEPSEEFRQMYAWILDDLYDQICSAIAENRNIEIQQVRDAIDRGPLMGREARQSLLVDQLLTQSEWKKSVQERLQSQGQPEWLTDFEKEEPESVDLSNPFTLLATLLKGPKQPSSGKPIVAIVHAEGIITGGRSGESLFGGKTTGAKTLVRIFRTLQEDPKIAAVIFRIDSPGGSALASEQIYQAVRDCGKVKPVISSIANMGASGGYYLAVGSETIVADPSAIIGSIGVVSGKIAISGTLEKLHIGRYEMTRGQNAGWQLSRPWNDREEEVLRRHAQQIYDLFENRVAESRGDKIASIAEVAQGRIFTARQARENGMVDELGGLRVSVNLAKEAANIDKCEYVSYPRPRTLADLLQGNEELSIPPISPESNTAFAWLTRAPGVRYLLGLAEMLQRDSVLTAVPFAFTIQY